MIFDLITIFFSMLWPNSLTVFRAEQLQDFLGEFRYLNIFMFIGCETNQFLKK